MRAITLLASILIVLGVVWSLDGEEMIKGKSPDGKFALRLIHGEEGWETSIVELPSKKKIIDLEVVATSGDHERRAWVASVDTFRIEDYATLPITGSFAGIGNASSLARVNFMRIEPGPQKRVFINDLNVAEILYN